MTFISIAFNINLTLSLSLTGCFFLQNEHADS